jgi:hypothetical protein
MVATQVRSTSAADTYGFARGRGIVTRSNGISYLGAVQSDGNLHIYQISADRSSIVDKISIVPAGTEAIKLFSLALFQSDNSLAVIFNTTTATHNYIKYVKVNTSTWATPTQEQVFDGGTTLTFTEMDLDVSDTDMPIVSRVYKSSITGAVTTAVDARGTTSGTWTNVDTTQLTSNGTSNNGDGPSSVICLGIAGGLRDVVFAAGYQQNGGQFGVSLYTCRVTETTGAISGTKSLRTVYMGAGSLTGGNMRARLFRRTTNRYDFAGMNKATKVITFATGQFSGTTWTDVSGESSIIWNKTWASMAMTYGYGPNGLPMTTFLLRDGTYLWVRNFQYGGTPPFGIMGGEGRYYPGDDKVNNVSDASVPFPLTTKSDVAIGVKVGANNTIWDANNTLPSGIVLSNIIPADGATQISSNPDLSVQVDTGLKYGPSPYMMEFQFAADVGFTTSVQTYRQDYTVWPAIGTYVDGTDSPGVTVTISDTLKSITLGKGVWFYRVRLTDVWDNVSPWSTVQSFGVGQPPTAIATSPVGSGYYAWNGGLPLFAWGFGSSNTNDSQTAYRVILYDSAGATLVDTGKVISSAQSYTPAALAAGHKNEMLSWQVQVWNNQDTASALTTAENFTLTDLPTPVITAPAAGAVITTGAPVYTFTATTGGGRRVSGYSVLVTSGSGVTYKSATIPIDVASGTAVSFTQPPNYLANNGAYTVQVSIVDDAGMVGVSPPIAFTTAWTPPASVTGISVVTTSYDLEGAGYTLVSWADTARAAGFTHWSVYRKDDLIDDSGNVIAAGTFKLIYDDYDVLAGGNYAYKDYVAPANYKVTYAITQWINTSGQDVESNQAVSATVTTSSPAYWLISLDVTNNSATTMKLALVTDDAYTEEQEETEFTVIGRGRVVNRGQYLGPKGSLTVRLRNTGTTTARQKRLSLLAIQQLEGELFLRNPFGDIWSVNMSNMAISRIAGVGTAEFCDVTIPYAEVS